jgi:ATP-binding cassette subfamily B protein
VLVLDEPTANLDAVTNEWIRNTISDQRGAGRTVIIITHSPGTVAIADDVIVLDKGVLVCSGSMADPVIEAQVARVMPDYTPSRKHGTSVKQFQVKAAAHRKLG